MTGRIFSEEAKAKMRLAWTKRGPVSQEIRDRISATLTGRKTGSKLTPEGKARMIAANKGRKNTPEQMAAWHASRAKSKLGSS